MAKVTITIEDIGANNVRVVCDPKASELIAKMHGQSLTSAEGYALMCINTIRQESKKQGPIRLIIPGRVRRR